MGFGNLFRWFKSVLPSFLPFMGEKRFGLIPIQVFQDQGSRLGVVEWKTLLVDALTIGDPKSEQICDCFVVSAQHCKASGGKEHEFLRLLIKHRSSQSQVYIIVERFRSSDSSGSISPSTNSSSRDLPLPSPSSSSSDNPAHDQVYFTRYESDPRYPHRIMATMAFPEPSRQPPVLDLALILVVVHQNSECYKLFVEQCYWYAAVVWCTLREEFGGSEEINCTGRSMHWGIQWVDEKQKADTVRKVGLDYRAALASHEDQKVARDALKNQVRDKDMQLADKDAQLAVLQRENLALKKQLEEQQSSV
ncbi:hypothetical protein JAAARDRAFT_75459 [Jaapia argillacea MUCL 33604]|uniref:Uncharacterized protein n=1 Tax=Jaapia argillacea MUCL 33604 TaxID=933084 RepID=A0A067QNH7_9AGAM|nr:hypothetical protein JAAARDRAFT_75459 [Jaapia argillacea MUCL 33604]